jgi:hypothetical protein
MLLLVILLNGFSLTLKVFPQVDHVSTRAVCLRAATVYCFNDGYDVMKLVTHSLQQIQAMAVL